MGRILIMDDHSMYTAEVLAHSISRETGASAITMRVTMPRIVLAEFNTHRVFSRNTSSSRAIPITKMIKHVWNNMFIPVYWGANIPGMQAKTELEGWRRILAEKFWVGLGKGACLAAYTMNALGVHKQISNRLIENFSYVTVIFTTTDIMNFLKLRLHPDAQPEIRRVAEKIFDAYISSEGKLLEYGEWHLPLVTDEEKSAFSLETQKAISVARCASTSYTTVDGKPMTVERAQDLVDKLSKSNPIHASPFEHQLTPDRLIAYDIRKSGSKTKYTQVKMWEKGWMHGNTVGFIQNRKLVEGAVEDSVIKNSVAHLHDM